MCIWGLLRALSHNICNISDPANLFLLLTSFPIYLEEKLIVDSRGKCWPWVQQGRKKYKQINNIHLTSVFKNSQTPVLINYLSPLPKTLPDLVSNTRWAEAFLLLGCTEQPGSHTPPGCSSILGHSAHASAGSFISSHPLVGLYPSILLLLLPCFNPLE